MEEEAEPLEKRTLRGRGKAEEINLRVDSGFFAGFEVSPERWYVRDRIERAGFIYVHILTGRLLALVNNLDRARGRLNGYSIYLHGGQGPVEEYMMPLSIQGTPNGAIIERLSQLDLDYIALGPLPEHEREDYYHQFLVGMGMKQQQLQEPRRVLRARAKK